MYLTGGTELWAVRRGNRVVVPGYIHISKGPLRVGFIRILQNFRDTIKFLKDSTHKI